MKWTIHFHAVIIAGPFENPEEKGTMLLERDLDNQPGFPPIGLRISNFFEDVNDEDESDGGIIQDMNWNAYNEVLSVTLEDLKFDFRHIEDVKSWLNRIKGKGFRFTDFLTACHEDYREFFKSETDRFHQREL